MSVEQEMKVLKRNGKYENIGFDKILKRVKSIGTECGIKLNYTTFVMKVIDQLYDGIPTTKIDELTAEQCATLSVQHPDYNTLAGRIIISNHHKNTESSFFSVMKKLHEFTDIHNNQYPLISSSFFSIVEKYKEEFDNMIVHDRDYIIDYFGFKTLERAYLMKYKNVIVERPQYLWLRVAIGIHGDNLEKVKNTYDLMSQKYFTHATPTLFNAGTPKPQLSSCYLLSLEDDSISGIYNTLSDCAQISKWAGGIGLHIHNVRAQGSHIRGTNGSSNGIVPMLRVFNNTARYVDQCIVPETIIYTTQGPIKIEDAILNNTKIINNRGEHETIGNVLEHPYDGDIYNIETMHSIHPLKITGEHPVLSLSGQTKELKYDVIKNSIDKKIISPDWKDVKDLTIDDMVVYSIPKYQEDIDNISEDDCYFYGILLGYGCLDNNHLTGTIYLHTFNNKHVIEFCEKYLNNKCVKYNITITIDNNKTKIQWTKNIVIPIRHRDVYGEYKKKHIMYKWLNLPLSKTRYIVKGLIDTDCCKNNELIFNNTSEKLIESLRYILLRMGVPTSGYIHNIIGESHMTTNGIIENKKIEYCLRIPQTKEICELLNIDFTSEYHNFFSHNNYIYSRIKNITRETYTGTLYDLQMPIIHNYLTHNGLIHNGGGRRNGSFAIYLEPWHADIDNFLEMKKNHGDEEMKARDLFYALWIPDLFMERVKANGNWTLMCPDECPGLSDSYGDEFVKIYTQYENNNKGRKTIKARDLWFRIMDSQMETGTPYILYKDAANSKSNQKNLGTIKSSNLCTEIIEYSDDKETAVCNLASIGLSQFIKQDKSFDYDKLHEVTKVVTDNLNRVIDINFYPTEKTKRSNLRHRPIGLGVQGLADVFALMNIPFHSENARVVNKKIFETIYHASMEQSMEIAKDRFYEIQKLKSKDRYGEQGILNYLNEYDISIEDKPFCGAYSSFEGSPLSKGIFQFDMWNVTPSDKFNWDSLKQDIIKYGVRNSLLVAPMPTASTAQILGNNECFEPFTSNIYTRRTLAGEFIIVNKYLMRELIELKLWDDELKNNIIANNGSIQHIQGIPIHIKEKYKIVWEIPMKHLIDMAKDRGAFICQSQSLNLWMEEPTYKALTSMHFYSWDAGLKTGIYYLRRKAKHQAQQFTIEPEKKNSSSDQEPEICEMCSA